MTQWILQLPEYLYAIYIPGILSIYTLTDNTVLVVYIHVMYLILVYCTKDFAIQ